MNRKILTDQLTLECGHTVPLGYYTGYMVVFCPECDMGVTVNKEDKEITESQER